jgi:uncharacterized membrane protein YtjA (UPF0391 family)
MLGSESSRDGYGAVIFARGKFAGSVTFGGRSFFAVALQSPLSALLAYANKATYVPSCFWRETCFYTARRHSNMLYWAFTFFVVALLAAILGFGGIAVAAAGIAKILFFIFLVLFLVSLVAHMSRRV